MITYLVRSCQSRNEALVDLRRYVFDRIEFQEVRRGIIELEGLFVFFYIRRKQRCQCERVVYPTTGINRGSFCGRPRPMMLSMVSDTLFHCRRWRGISILTSYFSIRRGNTIILLFPRNRAMERGFLENFTLS